MLDKNLSIYQALIFDLDGTFIDSMPLHNRAWIEVLSQNGVTINEQFIHDMAGMSSERIVNILNKRFQKNLDPEIISTQKRNKYLEVIDQVQIFEPVFSLVKKYHQIIPMGIITGGEHEVVDNQLLKLDIRKYFQVVICSEDTLSGKDTAAPYILMCNKLAVDPSKCLFFDDGDLALKGAKLSGMNVIRVNVRHRDIFSLI